MNDDDDEVLLIFANYVASRGPSATPELLVSTLFSLSFIHFRFFCSFLLAKIYSAPKELSR